MPSVQLIGFCSSAVSDTISNSIRVIKVPITPLLNVAVTGHELTFNADADCAADFCREDFDAGMRQNGDQERRPCGLVWAWTFHTHCDQRFARAHVQHHVSA